MRLQQVQKPILKSLQFHLIRGVIHQPQQASDNVPAALLHFYQVAILDIL